MGHTYNQKLLNIGYMTSVHTYVTYFLKPEQAIFTDIEEKSSKRLSVCLRNPGNRPKPGKPRLFSVLAKEASGEGKAMVG
jgi:hypothetical protein